MAPEFDAVDEGDRRFRLIEDPPLFEHNIPLEQLVSVKDEVTREKWKLDNVIGQKLDYLIKFSVQSNNNLYYLETEVIRGKQFRKYLWGRITVFIALAVAFMEFLVRMAPTIFAHISK
jgi:hypothetical protein